MSLFPTTHAERIAPGSFQQPVPIPERLPGASPLVQVCFNKDWLPYILGCLRQLTLSTTWQVSTQAELDQIFGEANNLILIFQQALASCTISNQGNAGVGDDFMLRQNPANPCELQTSVDGVTWCTWADLSLCITNKQPAQGSTQPPAGGGCVKYNGEVSIGDRWMLPNNVNTGDVIHVSHANGLWSTPLDLFIPRCPDGNLWFEVACVEGTGHTEPGDPAPTINHDSLIATDGTHFYDCGPASDGMTVDITIGSGISNGNLFFLANTPDTSGSGNVIFDVEYCNMAMATWTHEFDFTSGKHGWFINTDDFHSCSYGNWVPGSGWESVECLDDGGTTFVGFTIRTPAVGPFSINSMQIFYDLVPGTNGAGEGRIQCGPNDGTYHTDILIPYSSFVSGTNQSANESVARTGQNYLFCSFFVGDEPGISHPGGSARLFKVIATGSGTDPFSAL